MSSLTINVGSSTNSTPKFNEVPVTSNIRQIFQEKDLKVPISLYTLKRNVLALEGWESRLTDAKENPLRDKMIAIAASIFALALPVLIGLGTYLLLTYCGGYSALEARSLSILIGVVGGSILSILLAFPYQKKWLEDTEDHRSSSRDLADCRVPGLLPIVLAVVPVWRTFGNISRYQKERDNQRDQVQTALHEANLFYKTNTNKLIEVNTHLTNTIISFKKVLQPLIKKLPIKSSDLEMTANEEIQRLTEAQQELKKLTDLFKKFCSN